MTDELIVIPFSHYCEKARWALQLGGVGFRERRFLPGVHVWAAKRALEGTAVGAADGHSSRYSTPILKTRSGPLSGSTTIARYGTPALFEGDEVGRWVERFDSELGPHTRRAAYFMVFETPGALVELASTNVDRAQALAFRVAHPFIVRWMRRGMAIDRRGFERSRAKVDRLLAEVGERLADGRPYLTGERFTAADLTFAALMAPVLLPERYGAALPPPSQLNAEGAALVERYRQQPAGRFALRLYEHHR